MRIKQLANTYLIFALIFGAMMPVMLKVASRSINITEFIMLATLAALPVSFASVLLRKKTGRLASTIRNGKELALIAFLGILYYGAVEYGLTFAEKFVSASLATVIYRSFPLLMLMFLPVMLRERVSKYQLVALMLGFAGIYVAATGGTLIITGAANAFVVALVVGVAVGSAYATVAVKKYSFDIDIAMFLFNFATFVLFAAIFLASGARFQPVSARALVAILYVGMVYNVFVGLMYYNALRMIKTTFVTNIYFLSPFITFVFSWIVLGEQIYLYYIVIALLVSAGILIQHFDKIGGTYLSRRKRGAQSHVFHDVTSAFIHTDVPLIYNAIRSGGKVLAIKMADDIYESVKPKVKEQAVSKGAVLYTSSSRRFMNEAQEEFVKDMMGVKDGETVLLCAGNPDASEAALLGMLPEKE